MMGWVFAIVITASVGSFVQDLFLPKFLRRAEDTPKKAEPEATERSTLAMVLDDMESLDLITASVVGAVASTTIDSHLASTGLARRPAA
jgi:hypothetical protein